jgi:predicted  nucleic acid-binding Zn-ribbon protein
MYKDEVELNRITNGDIGTLNLVVTSMREIESALDLKKNEIENKKKYTRQDLATMDLAVARIEEMAIVLKHHRDEMEERLKSHSLELYAVQPPLKGMNIQDF